MFSERTLDQGYKRYKLARPDELAVPALQALDDMEAGGAVLVVGGPIGAGEPPPPEELIRNQATLVDKWGATGESDRKRMLAAISDSVTAGAEGVDRLEPLRGLAPLRRRGHP